MSIDAFLFQMQYFLCILIRYVCVCFGEREKKSYSDCIISVILISAFISQHVFCGAAYKVVSGHLKWMTLLFGFTNMLTCATNLLAIEGVL